MTVKNGMRPIHPGEILREEFMIPLGLSANALAIALRVPAPRINDIVRERRAISADTALRLARYFGTTAQFWLNLQSTYDLKQAEILLNQMQEHPEQEEAEPFAIAEIPLAGDSPWLGRSLAELRFRQEFDATVIGIRRGPEQIVSPGPDETLHPADHVILIGPSAVLNKLKQKREL